MTYTHCHDYWTVRIHGQNQDSIELGTDKSSVDEPVVHQG